MRGRGCAPRSLPPSDCAWRPARRQAETLANDIRTAINAGTFERAADRRARELRELVARPTPATPDAVTLEVFAKKFVDNQSRPSGKKTWTNDKYMFAQLAAFTLTDVASLGAKALGAITEDDLEAFYAHLRTIGRAGRPAIICVAAQGVVPMGGEEGYLSRSPISDLSMLKRTKIAQRARRLVADVLDKDGNIKEPGEERRLLGTAGRRLQWLIISALETGCRGELLSLQWADVDRNRAELRIRAAKAKDAEDRILPISARLAGVLEMAKTDPAGQDFKPGDYVFGEVGQQVANVKRAWETAVLKSYSRVPTWSSGTLGEASRAALQAIDLHFHELAS